ncbi:MAG: hypothetical protein OER86_09395, partial [Phycisphaerae bacterium]|nr:hypothetical protein [Phycisphaerae bacterium]
MQAKLSRFIQRCRGRLEIQGRPRHEAEFVRVGACRCRVMATIVFFMNLIDGWLLLSIPDAIAFAWDQATVVIVCKGVVAVILLCILIPSGKINIAHARLWLLVCATTILTATAVVVGATGLDARITVMLGNWTIVVLALVPMKPLQLVAVHAVTIITLAVTTTAAGQAANINPNWPLLWPTSAMGIMGILINLWHRNMFRRQFYTEIVLKRRTAQADRLLDAALTRPVAQQIRETGSFPTGIYEACIIACDIVGFSHLCRTMTHRQVVHELNR